MVPFLQRCQVLNNFKYLNTSLTIRNTASISRMDYVLDISKTITEPMIGMVLWLEGPMSTLRAPLYNRTTDLCSFLQHPEMHRLPLIVYREIKANGNMPTRCPFLPGPYHFSNVAVSRMRLPSFFFISEYRIDIDVTRRSTGERYTQIQCIGSIKKVKCAANERC
ncbi:uncharacterized protein LOC118464093 [Anopheles albimanus]|nr:uncharacterized protein LOC118464093 [Anopheles albimanus]